MSPFEWLTQRKAASELGITRRQLKRWLSDTNKRDILGAVRKGKQWRIRRPKDLGFWAARVRCQIRDLGNAPGARLPGRQRKVKAEGEEPVRRRGLDDSIDQLAKRSPWPKWVARWMVAALAQAGSAKGRIGWNKATRRGLVELYIHCSEYDDESKAEENLPRQLRRYWPKRFFEEYTEKEWESKRREIDYVTALRILRRRSSTPPNAEKMLPLLHRDWRDQINAWGREADEKQLKSVKIIDLRTLTKGISLRTFRNRYPDGQANWKMLKAEIFPISNVVPSVDNPVEPEYAGEGTDEEYSEGDDEGIVEEEDEEGE